MHMHKCCQQTRKFRWHFWFAVYESSVFSETLRCIVLLHAMFILPKCRMHCVRCDTYKGHINITCDANSKATNTDISPRFQQKKKGSTELHVIVYVCFACQHHRFYTTEHWTIPHKMRNDTWNTSRENIFTESTYLAVKFIVKLHSLRNIENAVTPYQKYFSQNLTKHGILIWETLVYLFNSKNMHRHKQWNSNSVYLSVCLCINWINWAKHKHQSNTVHEILMLHSI